MFPPGLGVYLNGNGSFGHRDSDDEELGFDYRNLGFTLGADYRLSDNTVAGGALGYVNSYQDFNRDKGEIDVNTVAFSGYGAHRIKAFYVDGIVTYAHGEVDLEREIGFVDRTAKGDTSSDEFSVAFGSGYEFESNGFTYGPMMDWEWIWLDIRSFTESNADGLNLKHRHDSMKSATVDLGVEGSYPISTRFGVFIPQLSVAWAHQFEDDTREIKARYKSDDTGLDEGDFFVETDSPDRNYAKLSAALSASLQGGWSAFASYQAIVGHNRLSYHGFSFGGRHSF
jgi:outer membrane autotransporter protein